MITYTYKINDLTRNKSGIIIAAVYEITASDGTYSNAHTFHTAFSLVPKAAEIPFAEVTEDIAVGWIKDQFDTTDENGVKTNQNEEQALAELEAYIERQSYSSEVYVPPADPIPFVLGIPTEVTMKQARLALLSFNMLDQVDAMVASLTGEEGEQAKIIWEYASTVRRDDPLVIALTTAMALTKEQLDALFSAAAAL
jgi:hypothetical protein